jgi:hypothetical protein
MKLKRGPGEEIGMQVLMYTREPFLVVKEVLAGKALDRHCKENPSEACQPGDRIHSIQGVSSDSQAMVKELSEFQPTLDICFERVD